jgi:dephospho-CoA kinase
MIKIAITGSICSGKSFLLNYYKRKLYPVFSADDCVSKLYKQESIRKLVVEAVDGVEIFDKVILAEKIYGNSKNAFYNKARVEEIIHPLVRKEMELFFLQSKKNFVDDSSDNTTLESTTEVLICFCEIPLLFETGFNTEFDKVITVYSEYQNRKDRFLLRSKKLDYFYQVDKLQIDQEEKIKLSDFSINADFNLKDWTSEADCILNQITK